MHVGFNIKGETLVTELQVSTLQACQALCVDNNECFSIVYENESPNSCKLFAKIYTDLSDNFVYAPGFVYADFYLLDGEWKVLISMEKSINPLRAKSFKQNINIYLYFYVIPPRWYDTGSWNPSSSKTRTYLFYIVNIMAADVLAMQGARASATMIMT